MCRGSDLLIKFLITSRAPSDTVSLFIFVLFVSAAGLVYASEYVVVGFRWGFRPSHRIKVYFGVFFSIILSFHAGWESAFLWQHGVLWRPLGRSGAGQTGGEERRLGRRGSVFHLWTQTR